MRSILLVGPLARHLKCQFTFVKLLGFLVGVDALSLNLRLDESYSYEAEGLRGGKSGANSDKTLPNSQGVPLEGQQQVPLLEIPQEIPLNLRVHKGVPLRGQKREFAESRIGAEGEFGTEFHEAGDGSWLSYSPSLLQVQEKEKIEETVQEKQNQEQTILEKVGQNVEQNQSTKEKETQCVAQTQTQTERQLEIPIQYEKQSEKKSEKQTQVRQLNFKFPSRTAKRLVSFADFHGDFTIAKKALATAKIIDEKTLQWIAAPGTVVVQTGDIVDRGNSAREIYDMLFRLQDEAMAIDGCELILLMGNHEAMRLTNPWKSGGYEGDWESSWEQERPSKTEEIKEDPVEEKRDRTSKEFTQISQQNFNTAWAPGKWIRREIESRYRVFAIVNGILFVHGNFTWLHLEQIQNLGVKVYPTLKVYSSDEKRVPLPDETDSPFFNEISGVVQANGLSNLDVQQLCEEMKKLAPWVDGSSFMQNGGQSFTMQNEGQSSIKIPSLMKGFHSGKQIDGSGDVIEPSRSNSNESPLFLEGVQRIGLPRTPIGTTPVPALIPVVSAAPKRVRMTFVEKFKTSSKKERTNDGFSVTPQKSRFKMEALSENLRDLLFVLYMSQVSKALREYKILQKDTKGLYQYLDSKSHTETACPFWSRYFEYSCAFMDQAFEKLKVYKKALIVGHTIQHDGIITPKCGGKHIFADTAMSRAFKGEKHRSLSYTESFGGRNTLRAYYNMAYTVPDPRKVSGFLLTRLATGNADNEGTPSGDGTFTNVDGSITDVDGNTVTDINIIDGNTVTDGNKSEDEEKKSGCDSR